MTNQPDSDSNLGDGLNLILVLSRGNLMLHVGTPQDVVDHFELSEPAVDQVHDDESADLQFYSSTASRLSVGDVFAAARGDASSGPTGKRHPDDEDASELLARIDDSLMKVQHYLEENPDAGGDGLNLPPITRLPAISGTYPQVLEQLAQLLGSLQTPGPNRGGFFHNLWHRATGTS